VCDPVRGRAEAAAAKYGVAAWYATYEELLADPAVDAVTICTPIGLHYGQGLMAVRAGKHLHFNKTMTTTVAEADHLIDEATANDICVVASPGEMLHPCNQRARKLVLDGALGRLAWAMTGCSGVGFYHVKEEFRTGEGVLNTVDPTWYFQRPGGGPQYDLTVYCLHALTGILGPARRVTALSGMVLPVMIWRDTTIACDMDDTTMLLLDFGDALFAVVYASVAGRLTKFRAVNVFGTEGSIVDGQFGDQDLKLPGDHQPHVVGAHVEMAESHVFEDLMQLVDWVRDGKRSIVDMEHARHVIDIIESAYRAAETGQAQDLRTTFEPLPMAALA
jgi:predicted dehydrogenase